MKKTIIWILIALASGAILGKLTFDKYESVDLKKVINVNDNVYMLKYGSYNSIDDMTDKITDVDRYIYIENNGEITAYIGIFASKDNANKLKAIYDKKKVATTIEKLIIDNDEFIQNLNEYEKLLSAATDEESLLLIEKQILSCYEQLVVENEQ